MDDKLKYTLIYYRIENKFTYVNFNFKGIRLGGLTKNVTFVNKIPER